MKRVVERQRNKTYYRVFHLPIWLWVFFILPGHLTYALYLHGPDRRHGIWLLLVFLVCAWRGLAGRLPGVEPSPYITHYGEDKPNLPYRVVCYTTAWIAIFVPYVLNLMGLVIAATTGRWLLADLYARFYYPLALAVMLGTFLDWTPRARRSTRNEGAEKAWFYAGIWTVVPAQVAAWGAWRLGGKLGQAPLELGRFRLATFLVVSAAFLLLSLKEKLPRTQRYYLPDDSPATPIQPFDPVRDPEQSG
jgi:hypothetical protein